MEQDLSKKPGAGIVIVKYFDGVPKILGLMDDDAYDLPKGSMEPGENILQTALRETEEESGITLINFAWGLKHIALGGLTLFIATTDEDPIIRPNPVTKKFEHSHAKWLHFDEQVFKPALQPAVRWANAIIAGGYNVDL